MTKIVVAKCYIYRANLSRSSFLNFSVSAVISSTWSLSSLFSTSNSSTLLSMAFLCCLLLARDTREAILFFSRLILILSSLVRLVEDLEFIRVTLEDLEVGNCSSIPSSAFLFLDMFVSSEPVVDSCVEDGDLVGDEASSPMLARRDVRSCSVVELTLLTMLAKS